MEIPRGIPLNQLPKYLLQATERNRRLLERFPEASALDKHLTSLVNGILDDDFDDDFDDFDDEVE